FSLTLFLVAVIGGLASVPGALLGAAYLTFVDYSPFTREPLSRLFATGVFALVVLLIVPNGVGSWLYDLRDALLRAIARRRKLRVPSLLADVVVDEDGNPVEAPRAESGRGERRWRLPTLRRRSSAVVDGPATGDNILEVRGLDVAYGRTQVLFGVD